MQTRWMSSLSASSSKLQLILPIRSANGNCDPIQQGTHGLVIDNRHVKGEAIRVVFGEGLTSFASGRRSRKTGSNTIGTICFGSSAGSK